ncbi:MAG TPA: LysM domain-containing protein [Puia sp.]
MSSITNNPLQALLQQTGQLTSYFNPGSRYYTTEVATYTGTDGNEVKYIRRRFVPSADEFVLLRTHTVTEGERLDNIANQYLGDPLQFWQLCDANNALDPEELTDPAGRKIRITLPRGIPGNPNNA